MRDNRSIQTFLSNKMGDLRSVVGLIFLSIFFHFDLKSLAKFSSKCTKSVMFIQNFSGGRTPQSRLDRLGLHRPRRSIVSSCYHKLVCKVLAPRESLGWLRAALTAAVGRCECKKKSIERWYSQLLDRFSGYEDAAKGVSRKETGFWQKRFPS